MQRIFTVAILFYLSFQAPLFAQSEGRPPEADKRHSLFLIGDAGAPEKGAENISFFREAILKEKGPSTTVFLGDNLYPNGLSGDSSGKIAKEEKALYEEFAYLKDYEGRSFVIPGNHDWAQGSKKGRAAVCRQENFVNRMLQDTVFFPQGGCPGPVEIELNEEIVLILLDTEWFLYPWHKDEENQSCEYGSADEVYIALNDAILRNSHRKVIVAGHHPVHTYGEHGGNFSLKSHLFPLTEFASWAYLPLPVLGSIYPVSRQLGVSPQDLSNQRYKTMSRALEEIFKQHKNIVYASGHEHVLESIEKDGVHHIVSGSGSKSSYVRDGEFSDFVSSHKGFVKLSFYADGQVWADYFSSETEDPVIFSKKLMDEPYKPEPSLERYSEDLKDSVVITVGGTNYAAGKGKMKWFGKNYREEWTTPVEVPVFDIGSVRGGLKIVQRGGGQATKSLRLEDRLGNQFVLRSINKDPVKALPEQLRKTIAKTVIQDQISANHPYAALTIPMMADAIGIYHSNPKLVYLPDDPRLGIYRADFANTLCLFEERPSDNTGEIAGFGYAKKIKNTAKALEQLREDNDNKVDFKFAIRSRLFDMVIGDWDRHDDQWRWARVKNKRGGYTFRPIPRDRDQAFFVSEGIVMSIASHKWIIPKFEGFNDDIDWVEGFNFNARYFDRTFLVGADLEDWEAQADSIQHLLSDEVIERAVGMLPEQVFELSGAEIIRKIKSRRDKLNIFAADYFKVLAKKVDVLGTQKDEIFEIERRENGDTKLTVRKLSKKGKVKQKLFKRVFRAGETKEVRVYGFGGDDQFVVKGDAKSPIKIRVIGGGKGESFSDQTVKSHGSKKNVLFYSLKGSQISVEKGVATKLKLSKDPAVTEYERYTFKYNTMFPLAYVSRNVDDGMIFGLGGLLTAHGFRKSPFAQQHKLILGSSFKTGGFRVRYKGEITNVLGAWDLVAEVKLNVPSYNSNFYGLGNNSEVLEEVHENYHRLIYERNEAWAALKRDISSEQSFSLGLAFMNTKIRYNARNRGRFIGNTQENGLTEREVYDAHAFVGLNMKYEFDRRDRPSLTRNGTFFGLTSTAFQPLQHNERVFGKIEGELGFYWTFRLPMEVTLAARFAGATNIGDYHFLASNTLGGYKSLKGFRKDRFYGRSSLMNSLELRFHLAELRTSVLPIKLGATLFNDVGRVWLDGEDSKRWHHSYGAGLYLAPLDLVALSIGLGLSKDSTLIYMGLGFSF